MKRFECIIIKKNVCPYEEIDGKTCSKCTIPDIYLGIRPNVPESHCEAGKHMPYDKKLKSNPEVVKEIDRLYKYMMEHSKVFKAMAINQRGELIVTMKKALDKNKKF